MDARLEDDKLILALAPRVTVRKKAKARREPRYHLRHREVDRRSDLLPVVGDPAAFQPVSPVHRGHFPAVLAEESFHIAG